MADRIGGRFSTAGLTSILLILAAGLAVAWLVVQAAAVQTMGIAAAPLAPGHPVSANAALARVQGGGGRINPGDRRVLERVAGWAPMQAEPFLAHAVDALAAGDTARAERLLKHVVRLNPRSRTAHLLLLEMYLRANRREEATQQVRLLHRVQGSTSTVLVQQFVRLASIPEYRQILRTALKGDPLLDIMLVQMVNNGADPNTILEFAVDLPPTSGSQRRRRWQGSLVRTLVRRGELARARQLWRQFNGVTGATSLIYDPTFRRLPGSAPFNWQLETSSTGAAQMSLRNTLEITYFGRSNGPLASQLLMLPPGRYLLSVRAEGSASGEGSRLEWTIRCERGPRLLTLPMVGVASAPRTLEDEFTVPATGCQGQWLRLSGIAGEFAATQSAIISGLNLARVTQQ